MKPRSIAGWLAEKSAAVLLAALGTLGVFLLLPLMQAIGDRTRSDLEVRQLEVAALPPPPPPPAEEPPPEEPDEAPPPELLEEAPPLDLSQLELALQPATGAAFGDFTLKLAADFTAGGSEELDRIFSLAELDQQPRVMFQRAPTYPPELRKRKRQGTVYILFMVDKRGRVSDPRVEKSTDPAFDQPALEAVRQWRFEPGTRNGETVSFKMRVPITFNAT